MNKAIQKSLRIVTSSVARAGYWAVLSAVHAPSASAASLEDYYRTMMTIKACAVTVTEDDWDKLTGAIEDSISAMDTSSETVNQIFDEISDEMRVNFEGFCTTNGSFATQTIAEIL